MVIIICTLLFVVAARILGLDRESSRRAMCASNLRQIGLALNTYPQESGEQLPRVPIDAPTGKEISIVGADINRGKSVNGGQSPWRNLRPNAIDDPYEKDRQGKYTAPAGTPTVSSSLWLLCRYNIATPKMFICPAVRIQRDAEDPLLETDNQVRNPKFFSDFYTDPRAGALISYSFILPHSNYWRTDGKPGYIIAGDDNNGSDPVVSINQQDKIESTANSRNHNGRGQNTLGLDAAVKFVNTPYAGVDGDNIYTAVPDGYTGQLDQTPGILRVQPLDRRDSVLIPVQEERLAGWDRKP
jgi:hypothetical protein